MGRPPHKAPSTAPTLMITGSRALADMIGVGLPTLDQWFHQGLPREPSGKGRAYTFDLRLVIAWCRAHKWVDPKRPAATGGGTRATGGESDPLLDGAPSPALERYRMARAEAAELDLGTKKSQLLPRADVHLGLSRIATVLRGAGERLQRDHGDDARSILDDAITDAERELTSLCQPVG